MKNIARKVKHQVFEWQFSTLFKTFLTDTKKLGNDPQFVSRLVYYWGNSSMASGTEYASRCIETGTIPNAIIYECGSGLSSLLAAGVGKAHGTSVYTFEDHPEWAQKMQGFAKKFELNNLHIFHTPLKSYGNFEWYDVDNCTLPKPANVVLCDGPPGFTKGGRYGLFPVLMKHFNEKTTVILDDFNRQDEKEIAEKWYSEFGWKTVAVVGEKSYAVLQKNG
ncbi:MAG: class I SAM-dependent methyltransferase [Schleiferiaceae bacterium]|nr:class I SAM-dependent methyltransferase [Schleiferiaceae bacterium]